MKSLTPLILGLFFGVVLVKTEVATWFRIQKMFRFEEAYMFLVMASAIAVGALSLILIRKLGLKGVDGAAVAVKEKPFQKGTIFGGAIFGMGWAMTGACPGPIYAQMGSGEYMALFTFLGACGGAYLYAFLRPRLPH